jgi:RNA polymerase sigma factor (sigma-70 family)
VPRVKSDDAGLRGLMALAQQGDRDAYRHVMIASQDWLRRYFWRRVPPLHLDDLVQETLMSLHAKRASFDCRESFFAWLAVIARRRWVDHLRRAYRWREATQAVEAGSPGETAAEPTLIRLGVEQMLERLPPRQAEAIRLTRLEGFTAAEAAARCDQSETLVRVNIHRGLKRLHELVEEG